MSETLQMTQTELDAMRLNAMINGIDLEQLQAEASEDDDFDIEIIDETPKKKGRAKAKKEEKPKKREEVPMLEKFSRLKSSTMNVTFNQHDIPYKEQLWPIPPRTVEYQVELVKSPKISYDIAQMFVGKSDVEKEKAYSGNVRYFKVVTYESVLIPLVTIGYIRVTANDKGHMSFKIKVEKEALKNGNANPDKVEKNIESAMKSIISVREKQ